MKEELKAAEEELAAAEAERDRLALRIPNLPSADVPDGSTEDDVEEIRRVGEPPHARRSARARRDRPLRHGARGAHVRRALRVLGGRHGAARTRALPPGARPAGREGVRHRPSAGARARGGADRDRRVPLRRGERLRGRGGRAVPRRHRGDPARRACTRARSSPPSELPLRYVAFSPCFRREAGAAGRDTRGMVRVHQFNKVEQFSFTRPEDSWDEHELLLANTEELVQALGLPYRVVVLPAGDISSRAAKTYDVEIWFPSQERYRETASISNTTDFQARRLGDPLPRRTRRRAGAHAERDGGRRPDGARDPGELPGRGAGRAAPVRRARANHPLDRQASAVTTGSCSLKRSCTACTARSTSPRGTTQEIRTARSR